MGCYLSTVDDKVYLTDGRGRNFKYATASCQGWRREQEDAEICIPNFDENASLFVLCDGHGGAEVAKYTVAHLPDFVKNHNLYKKGQYKEALKQIFVDFDAHLRTDEVMAELKRMAYDETTELKKLADEHLAKKAGQENTEEPGGEPQADTSAGPSSSANNGAAGSSSGQQQTASSSSAPGPSTSNGASTVVDDVDAETLRREASVPIAELLDKYADSTSKSRVQSLQHSSLGASPVIRNKESGDEQGVPRTSGDGFKNDPEPSSSKSTSDDGPSSTSSGFDLKSMSDPCRAFLEKYGLHALRTELVDGEEDSEDDSEFEVSTEEDEDEDDEDGSQSRTSTDEDDDSSNESEDDGDDEGDVESEARKSKVLSKKQKKSPKNRGETSDEEKEKDDESEYYDDPNEDYEDDEDDDYDESESEPEGLSLREEENVIRRGIQRVYDSRRLVGYKRRFKVLPSKTHTPGNDSGCTVVVALVKDGELYVASAGDSRCIVVMRNGECLPMSFDHKPEEDIEYDRIKKAGGHVTYDGRVNGGLNLSRAFGDFTYKDPELPAEQQMITPCPDVKTTPLDLDKVGYIFLACDGIWNSMQNSQIASCITRYAALTDELSDFCVRIFKQCLARDTNGDGTGCDNMTCIIVKYESPSEKDSSTNNLVDLKLPTTSDENNIKEGTAMAKIEDLSGKRSADDEFDDETQCKRKCLKLLELDSGKPHPVLVCDRDRIVTKPPKGPPPRQDLPDSL